MSVAERKFQILMKEWENVETHMHQTTQSRYRIRSWSVTIFSGLFALSMYQDQKSLLLIAAIVTFMFWTMDAMQNVVLNICFRREHKIEEILEDPTDDRIIEAKVPIFGRTFNDERTYMEILRKYLDPLLIVLYGSIYLVIGVTFIFI